MFNGQTITLLCFIVFSNRMIIFSTLKTYFLKFCTIGKVKEQ